MKNIVVATLVGLFFLTSSVAQASELPNKDGYITDNANVISQEAENQLEILLTEYEKNTTNNIVVLTTNDLQGQSLEEYSIHIVDKWKPGVKDIDNGLLLLLIPEHHLSRIEVGRGLEGEVTDIESHDILEKMAPLLKENKFDDAVVLGINEITSTILLPVPTEQPKTEQNETIVGVVVVVWIIIAIILFIIDPELGMLFVRITFLIITMGKSGSSSSSSGKFSGGGSSKKW